MSTKNKTIFKKNQKKKQKSLDKKDKKIYNRNRKGKADPKGGPR